MSVAHSAKYSHMMYVLLSIMTATTALIDIFIWAPLFATFSSFETCSGGWFTGKPYVCVKDYTKGWSRLVVRIFPLWVIEVFYSCRIQPHLLHSCPLWVGNKNLQTSMQSLFGGIFYLMTSVVAWLEYSSIRQDNKIKNQVAAFDAWLKSHQNESTSSSL